MSGTVTSVPEWAVGDPPPRRVLRGTEAAGIPLELPDISEPRSAAVPAAGSGWSPVWSAGYRDGFAEGLAAGRTEGRAKGEEEGVAAVSRSAEAALASLRSGVASARHDAEERLARIERGAVELALELAEMVLGHHTVTCDDPGGEALVRAMGSVRTRGPLVAHLNPEDLELMATDVVGSNEHLELVADPAVGRGGCLLDSGACRVDATIEAAVGRLRQVLSPHAGGEVTP